MAQGYFLWQTPRAYDVELRGFSATAEPVVLFLGVEPLSSYWKCENSEQ